MYALRRHVAEVVRSPFYRLNPREIILYTYAKWFTGAIGLKVPNKCLLR